MAAPIFENILGRAQARQQEAIAPSISALEARREPLNERFAGLIERIKGRETSELATAGREVSGQLERRGILGGSVPGRLLEQRTQPIRQFFTGETTQAGFAQEQGLADIALRILDLQRGATSQASQNALNIFGIRSSQFQAEQQRQLAIREAERTRKFQATQAEKQRAANLRIARINVSGGGTTSGSSKDFFNQAVFASNVLRGNDQEGGRFLQLIRRFASVMSLQQITRAYNASDAGKQFGPPKEDPAQIREVFNQARGSGGSGIPGQPKRD